jgi:hypothetical protein
VDPDTSDVARRLSNLRRAQPADATLRNLLELLTDKLALCRRLPIVEYEADSEGHEDCVAAFRHLADVERRSFDDLLRCLQRHLEQAPVDAGAAGLGDAGTEVGA